MHSDPPQVGAVLTEVANRQEAGFRGLTVKTTSTPAGA